MPACPKAKPLPPPGYREPAMYSTRHCTATNFECRPPRKQNKRLARRGASIGTVGWDCHCHRQPGARAKHGEQQRQRAPTDAKWPDKDRQWQPLDPDPCHAMSCLCPLVPFGALPSARKFASIQYHGTMVATIMCPPHLPGFVCVPKTRPYTHQIGSCRSSQS